MDWDKGVGLGELGGEIRRGVVTGKMGGVGALTGSVVKLVSQWGGEMGGGGPESSSSSRRSIWQTSGPAGESNDGDEFSSDLTVAKLHEEGRGMR